MKRRSLERDLIETVLMELAEDEYVSWNDLLQLTNKTKADVYQLVHSSQVRLAKEHRAHYVVERNRGVRRVAHAVVATSLVPKGTKRMNRAAKRNLGRIAAINLDQVDPADRTVVLAHGSIAAFVRASTTPKAVRALDAAAQATPGLTPTEAALRLTEQATRSKKKVPHGT